MFVSPDVLNSSSGCTALFFACLNGDPQMVKLLTKAGADVTIPVEGQVASNIAKAVLPNSFNAEEADIDPLAICLISGFQDPLRLPAALEITQHLLQCGASAQTHDEILYRLATTSEEHTDNDPVVCQILETLKSAGADFDLSLKATGFKNYKGLTRLMALVLL